MRRVLKLIIVNALVLLVLLLAVDRLLGFLGLPGDTPFQSAHQPDAHKQRNNIEFQHAFVTNSRGLRYAEMPLEKPPGEVRILVLGDSFTEGQGVEAADTFGAHLESHFRDGPRRDVRFINAGLGGQGPLQYWRVFHNVGIDYHPDGLLICLYANDLSDMPESLTREGLYRRYPQRQGIHKALHVLLPRIHTTVSETVQRRNRKKRKAAGFVASVSSMARQQGIGEAAIQRWQEALPAALVEATERDEFNGTLLSHGLLRPYYWTDALDIDTPRAEDKYLGLTLVLEEIHRVAGQRGMAVALVYIPAPLQYDPARHADWNPLIIGGMEIRKHWAHDTSEIQKRLADWAHRRQIPLLDLTPALRAEVARGRALNWKLDGHWNARGHRVAAREIARWIDDQGVFGIPARTPDPVGY